MHLSPTQHLSTNPRKEYGVVSYGSIDVETEIHGRLILE